MSRRRRTWPTPSSTSGFGGSPASAADSVSTRLQKLWKFETVIRERVAGPTASSSRAWSSFAALTLYVRTRICSGTSGPSKGRSRSARWCGAVGRRPRWSQRLRSAGGSRLGGRRRRRRRRRCRLSRRSSRPCASRVPSPFVSSSHRTRSMMTRVLPVPAPAMTTSGPSPYSTIRRCSGVRAAATSTTAIKPPTGAGSEVSAERSASSLPSVGVGSFRLGSGQGSQESPKPWRVVRRGRDCGDEPAGSVLP